MRPRLIVLLALVLLAGCAPAQPAATVPPPTTAAPPTSAPSPAPTSTPTPTAAPSATPTIMTAADLDASGEVSLELIAQTGGAVRSVAIEGDVAYVGVGPRLVAFDTGALPELREIGQSDLLPGSVRAVVVQEGRAYVGADHHVVALDVSDPAAMVVQGQLELPGAAADLALGEGTLYAAGVTAAYSSEPDGDTSEVQHASHVTAIDATRNLTLLSSQSVPTRVDQIIWINGILYGAGRTSNASPHLWAFEVHGDGKLASPTVVWDELQDANSLAAYGDVLLVGDFLKVVALDVSQPIQPELLWESDNSLHGIATGIAVRDGLLYTIGYQPAGGYVAARFAVELPQPLPTEEPAVASTNAALAGEHLLATELGLNVYPLSAFVPGGEGPEALPDPVANYLPVPHVDGVAVSDGVLTFDVANEFGDVPSAADLYTLSLPGLAPLGRLDVEGTPRFIGITAEDGRVYLTAQEGELWTVSVANPSSPTSLATQPLGPTFDWAQPVVAGGRLYASRGQERIQVIDVTNPGSPTVLASYATDHPAQALARGGSHLYYNDMLHLRVLDAGSLEELGSLAVPGIRHIAADGDLVAAASILDGLVLVSASDPANPEAVGRVEFQGADKVALSGDLAFIIARPNISDNENAQLLIVDISDPPAARPVGLVQSPPLFGFDPSVTTWGEYLIVHSPDAGIYVYRITERTSGGAGSVAPSDWPIQHLFASSQDAGAGAIHLAADASRMLLQEGDGWNRVVLLEGEMTTTLNAGPDEEVEGLTYGIALSDDGSTAAFWSSATDLTSDDASADCPAESNRECGSLYFYDVPTGVITRTAIGEPMGGVGRIFPSVALSQDGRHAVFTANGTLHSGTLVLDRATGALTEISPAALAADISADGRFVAFVEDGEVYVLDRQDGGVEWVSQPVSGADGEGESGVQPVHEGGSAHVELSADGRYVVYQSGATNLVERDMPSCIDYTGDELAACWHVYLFDRETGATELISVNDEGEPGDAISGGGSVSADGRYVLFHSFAGNLAPEGPITCRHYAQGNCPEVYLRDREAGRTVLVSRGWDGQHPDGPSWSQDITPDGHYAAITSSAGNLARGSEGHRSLSGNALLVDLPALLSLTEDHRK